jgi:ankyrin repeat protein
MIRDYGAQTPFNLACKHGSNELISYLLDNKVSVDPSESIHIMCENSNAYSLNYLMERLPKIDLNCPNKKNSRRPIHFACIGGKTDIIKLLLTFKVDVNVADGAGLKPIYYAIRHADNDAVIALLNAGAMIRDAVKAW